MAEPPVLSRVVPEPTPERDPFFGNPSMETDEPGNIPTRPIFSDTASEMLPKFSALDIFQLSVPQRKKVYKYGLEIFRNKLQDPSLSDEEHNNLLFVQSLFTAVALVRNSIPIVRVHVSQLIASPASSPVTGSSSNGNKNRVVPEEEVSQDEPPEAETKPKVVIKEEKPYVVIKQEPPDVVAEDNPEVIVEDVPESEEDLNSRPTDTYAKKLETSLKGKNQTVIIVAEEDGAISSSSNGDIGEKEKQEASLMITRTGNQNSSTTSSSNNTAISQINSTSNNHGIGKKIIPGIVPVPSQVVEDDDDDDELDNWGM